MLLVTTTPLLTLLKVTKTGILVTPNVLVTPKVAAYAAGVELTTRPLMSCGPRVYGVLSQLRVASSNSRLAALVKNASGVHAIKLVCMPGTVLPRLSTFR